MSTTIPVSDTDRDQSLPFDMPITEGWLKTVGFKWHQFDRQPNRHWILWLGNALVQPGTPFTDFEQLGIELSADGDLTWFCWLRSDCAHRYSRFVHIRKLASRGDLIFLIEGITGLDWDPALNLYGAMRTPAGAAYIREQEKKRADYHHLIESRPWNELEQDPDRGHPLHEHMKVAEEARTKPNPKPA